MNPLISNLTNKQFGDLKVLTFAGTKKGDALWNCLCICGKNKIILGRSLVHNMTKSCGCRHTTYIRKLRKANCLNPGEASKKALYRKYKSKAKLRKLKFSLTVEEFTKLTSSNCLYCSKIPNQINAKNGYNGDYVYNGIDRIDNKLGYHFYNCTACCKRCNFAKGDMELKDFIEHIKSMYKNITKQENLKCLL